MTGSVNISQLPNGQGISPVSAAATITLNGCSIGSVTPKQAAFTNVTVTNPDNSPGAVINVPVTGSLVIGQTNAKLTTSPTLTAVGYQALNSATSNPSCTAVGFSALQANAFSAGLGGFNTAIGSSSLAAITNGASNTAVGVSSGLRATVAFDNTLMGQTAGQGITTGSSNTFIGLNSGGNVTTGNFNICIGKTAQTVDATASNYLNIGGVIKGDTSVNWLNFTGGLVLATRVVTAAGAVTVALSDYLVVVNKSVGAATIVNLPATPVKGTQFRIKDGKGDANSNNITVTPAAGTIDGASTNVINTAYGKATYQYSGSEWLTV